MKVLINLRTKVSHPIHRTLTGQVFEGSMAGPGRSIDLQG